MITVRGKYTSADVYTDKADETTIGQIIDICSSKAYSGSNIKIMPDCHAGAGCVVGFTSTVGEGVDPNTIGVDIGCGIRVIPLGKAEINLDKLDYTIHRFVPAGFDIHETAVTTMSVAEKLSFDVKDLNRIMCSIGTLGGGNHFIEVDADDEGNKYLLIHTGSRNLGTQVAKHHAELAWNNSIVDFAGESMLIVNKHTRAGTRHLIEAELKELKKRAISEQPRCLTGKLIDTYLSDMYICQNYARANRQKIQDIICKEMGIKPSGYWESVHNYIDPNDHIIRKGAISAHVGERMVIPLNMRDGSLLCIGKGNPDWNMSAPHGAGRVMSRRAAKMDLSMVDYMKTMEGIYTSCVVPSTLDEAPDAYKPAKDIIGGITDTATIVKHILPLYNFKSK